MTRGVACRLRRWSRSPAGSTLPLASCLGSRALKKFANRSKECRLAFNVRDVGAFVEHYQLAMRKRGGDQLGRRERNRVVRTMEHERRRLNERQLRREIVPRKA